RNDQDICRISRCREGRWRVECDRWRLQQARILDRKHYRGTIGWQLCREGPSGVDDRKIEQKLSVRIIRSIKHSHVRRSKIPNIGLAVARGKEPKSVLIGSITSLVIEG